MAKYADKYFITSPWCVTERGFNESYNRVSESIFALGNEYMGVRGYFDEGTCADSLQGSYFNSIYEMDYDIPKSYKGIITKTHFMVNSANWLATTIEIDGERLCIGKSVISEFVRELSMYEGTLERSFIWQTSANKCLKLRFLRFVSMCENTSAYQRIELTPINFSGAATVECGIDFGVVHESMERCLWTEHKKGFTDEFAGIIGQTVSSGQRVFAGFCVQSDAAVSEEKTQEDLYIGKRLTISMEKGKTARVDKLVSCISDPDVNKTTLFDDGLELLSKQRAIGVEAAFEQHKAFWRDHWEHADVQIGGEEQDEDQQGIRFAIFQLTQTYHGGGSRHNIGAKGLTGEAYNGHTFWDTESYCLSYYLFTNPDAARSLLEYRYHMLDHAKKRAKMLDCEGACYPVATLNGEEACTLWQHASLQFQTNTAIAYAIRHYVNVTGDESFLHDYGARMLVEICRFLDSRGAYGQQTAEFGYFGVMGPDEFHMMVNNECYTNYMAKMSMTYTLEVLDQLQESPVIYARLCEQTGLNSNELKLWRRHAADMRIPLDEKSGVFEQHDGFFNLPHTEISDIPVVEFPLYHHWSYDRIYRSDMIKQSAVLMMIFLYNSNFDKHTKKVNYEFYEPRTIHESSLSPSVHSVLACELGKIDDATRFFAYATRLDLDNYNRNTREGLHTTSLAAAWINVIYGFGGMRSDSGTISLAPVLPAKWEYYSFKLNIRGSRLLVHVDAEGSSFKVECGASVTINIYGAYYTVDSSKLRIAFPQVECKDT